MVGWLMAHRGRNFRHDGGPGGSITVVITNDGGGEVTAQPGEWVIRKHDGTFVVARQAGL